MTDKTEAQPEALRLAEWLDCDATDADMGRKPIACTRRKSAAELRRQHAEIQQLKAEKAEMAALNYENYEFQRKKADAATATVYRFHYAMKDAGWHPGRTDDDLTDIIRAKGRELAQLSARQAAPDGWRLVPVEPTEEMVTAGQESFGVHDCYYAMLSAAPPPPEREPLTDRQIDAALTAWFGSSQVNNDQVYRDTMRNAINAAHGIGATNDNP